MKGPGLIVIASVLGGFTYLAAHQFQRVWPWPIFQSSNLGLLLGTAALTAGWLGWGVASVGWMNRRRQLGPGR